MQSVFTGPVYVVRDNIDTDQIIPAQYLNLIPTVPEEYEKLGSFALSGLPESLYPNRFVKAGQVDSEYFMTHGHFHLKPDRTEYYATITGEGALIFDSLF